MPYESLYKLYYKAPDTWEKTYQERFHSPFSHHLPLSIQQYNHRHSYPAFYCYTEEMGVLQDRIMSEFTDCLHVIEQIPASAKTQLLHARLIDEIKSTNDIEGVRSTRREILTALAVPPEHRHSYRLGSVVNKYSKIIQGEDIPLHSSQDIRNLYDDFLADEIRQDDAANLPDGKIFRQGSVDIIAATQKTIHRGLYPETAIIETMDKALQVLNDATIPIFARIAIFHYFFGYIHPFYDGNGRMGRFIAAYLFSKVLHPIVALHLSILIKKHRKQYYQLFSQADAEINCGDLTPFILGTLKFTEEAVTFTTQTLQEKYSQYQHEQILLDSIPELATKNKTTQAILQLLLQASIFSVGGISIKDIMQELHLSENTVYTHLRKIPEKYLLTDKRMKPYRYQLQIPNV